MVDNPSLPSYQLVDGTKLHLETAGSPTTPVVIVHGLYEVGLRVNVKLTETFGNPWSNYNVPAIAVLTNLVRHFGG